MDDDDKLTLRDKLAIEILNGALANGRDQTSTIMADVVYYLVPDYQSDGSDPKHDQAVKIRDEQSAKAAEHRMERLIRSCYKMADIMRKVRLTPFQ